MVSPETEPHIHGSYRTRLSLQDSEERAGFALNDAGNGGLLVEEKLKLDPHEGEEDQNGAVSHAGKVENAGHEIRAVVGLAKTKAPVAFKPAVTVAW